LAGRIQQEFSDLPFQPGAVAHEAVLTRMRLAGDVDAAIPGDLHLPRVVCYALAGEFRGTDERMMELLEPFRGHRFRIIRLLYSAGLDVPW